MSDFSDLLTATRSVVDPRTSAADLALITQAQPGLRAQVAAHPNAYPQLLDWLGEHGDAAVKQAVDARQAASSIPAVPPPPPPPAAAYPPVSEWAHHSTPARVSGTAGSGLSRRMLALIIAVAVVMAGVGIGVGIAVSHKSGGSAGLVPVVANSDLSSVVVRMGLAPKSAPPQIQVCISGDVSSALELWTASSAYFGKNSQDTGWGAIFLTTSKANGAHMDQLATCRDAAWTRLVERTIDSAGIRMWKYQGSCSDGPGYSYSATYGNVIVLSYWYIDGRSSSMSWDQWQAWAKKAFKPAVDAASSGTAPSSPPT